MKKYRKRILILIIAALMIYAVVLSVGLAILCNNSLDSHANSAFETPIEIRSSNESTGEMLSAIREKTGETMSPIQLFDTNGTLLADLYSKDAGSVAYYHYSCERYADTVGNGKTIRRATFVYDNSNSDIRIVMIYGTPLVNNGHVVASAFNIYSPLYLSRTLKTFVIFFTVVYIVMAISVIMVILMREHFMETRAAYIDNVTHSLKTPVTAIKALAETLNDGMEPNPKEQKVNLELILKQADLQAEMIQKMLSLSRIQTGRVKIKKKVVTGTELTDDLVKKHRSRCGLKKIALNVTEELHAIDNFYTDPEVARSIIDTFLDNAIKFTPQDGAITVDAKKNGKRAVISVTDTGVGIPKESLNMIFERFYTTSIANAEGNGLGLALAKELAFQLKEKIWAESETGKGTTLFLTLLLK